MQTTHCYGNDTYNVCACQECGKEKHTKLNTFYGKKAAEKLKATYPMLPATSDVCECDDEE